MIWKDSQRKSTSIWQEESNLHNTVRKYRRILITIKIFDPKFCPYKPQVSNKMEYINFKHEKSTLGCNF